MQADHARVREIGLLRGRRRFAILERRLRASTPSPDRAESGIAITHRGDGSANVALAGVAEKCEEVILGE